MFASATAIFIELLQGKAGFKCLSNRQSKGTDVARAMLKRETWSLFMNRRSLPGMLAVKQYSPLVRKNYSFPLAVHKIAQFNN